MKHVWMKTLSMGIVLSLTHLAAAASVPLKAAPFELDQVKLLDGPMLAARQLDQKYLLDLDPDRLLHVFRLTAGLPSSAEPLGGWEKPSCELRGHFVGHYLTACALMYRSTGDQPFKTRADAIVAELAKCQDALPAKGYNKGFLSAYPESLFDRVDACKKVWAPYYTLHKIMAGLLDVHVHCHNAQALDILNKMADWLKFRIDRLGAEKFQASLGNEHGGMNEIFANLYAVTQNPDHLRLALAFNHQAVFQPLAGRQDKLSGLHANTQIPKIIGAAREYELTGNESLKTVATFFWDRVALHRSYVIGGHSDAEHFFPIEDFHKHLSPVTAETCNTYNMLKLTRHLFAWEPSAQTMDFYERALFNQILASQDPQTGMMIYFASLKPGHFKVYNTPTTSFWCCTGTGVENHAKYNDTIYFHDADSLYLNLFIASELTWKEKGLTVRQETKFPEEDTSRLTFACDKPLPLAIKIRYPAWTQGMTVAINGAPEKIDATPNSYLTLQRTWQTGDKLEIRWPMELRTEPLPSAPSRVAVLYGPIVLAGALGTENMPANLYLPSQSLLNTTPAPTVPMLLCDPAEITAKIEPVPGQPLTFRTKGIGRPTDVTLIPFYRTHHQRYSVYWEILSAETWQQRQSEIAEREARRKACEARLVDEVNPGEPQPETDHKMKGESTDAGIHKNCHWRHATGTGYFSYEMKVLPDVPMVLQCSYWGADSARSFDILVNGKKIATQTINHNKPGQFFDVQYPIPPELTSGQQKATVRFQAINKGPAGGVFHCLMLKTDQ